MVRWQISGLGGRYVWEPFTKMNERRNKVSEKRWDENWSDGREEKERKNGSHATNRRGGLEEGWRVSSHDRSYQQGRLQEKLYLLVICSSRDTIHTCNRQVKLPGRYMNIPPRQCGNIRKPGRPKSGPEWPNRKTRSAVCKERISFFSFTNTPSLRNKVGDRMTWFAKEEREGFRFFRW